MSRDEAVRCEFDLFIQGGISLKDLENRVAAIAEDADRRPDHADQRGGGETKKPDTQKCRASLSPYNDPLGWRTLTINELCDYIDELPDEPEHCDHADRVRAEIREFVRNRQVAFDPHSREYSFHGSIIDFIDNGPKPTAERVAELAVIEAHPNRDPKWLAELAVSALRKAGLLKDGS